MKRCLKCGDVKKDEEIYCAKCGDILVAMNKQEYETQTKKQAIDKNTLKNKSIMVVLFGMTCIFIGIFIFYVVFSYGFLDKYPFMILIVSTLMVIGIVSPIIVIGSMHNEIKKEDTAYKTTTPTAPQPTNIPKCPTCGSTNVSPISAGARVGSIVMWGIFSNKIRKSFECKNCKYMW